LSTFRTFKVKYSPVNGVQVHIQRNSASSKTSGVLMGTWSVKYRPSSRQRFLCLLPPLGVGCVMLLGCLSVYCIVRKFVNTISYKRLDIISPNLLWCALEQRWIIE